MSDIDRLLLKKKELSEQIYTNTLAQSKSIAGEDIESLLTLVESRQQLLDSIAEIDKALKQYQAGSVGKEAMIESDIINLFKRICEVDKENSHSLSNIKEETFRRIQQVQHSKKAMFDGYMKQNISAYGYFLDKRK